ncbi:MAG: GAF domain-containing sensor histidine kinase [Candidatus Acidiferrales bacterium]
MADTSPALSRIPGGLNHPPAARLEDVLVTDDLKTRPQRDANLNPESLSLHNIAAAMATAPDRLLDTLVTAALDLCRANAAGVSLLEAADGHGQVFRWTNLAGTFAKYAGGTTPRDFSPCGVTLDRDSPQLFRHPAHYFDYFAEVDPPIVEALVIPLRAGEQTIGTMWIVSQSEDVKFDSEDVRLMAGLAEFTSCGLNLIRSREAERKARRDRESEIAAHHRTEDMLRQMKAELESEVEARTQQLQRLSSRLMASQDDERRRIARELHDSAGQYLAALQMNLGALRREALGLTDAQQARISDSMAVAERCNTEIRTMSYLLHPPLLDEIGLASALAWYADGFAHRSGIRIDLDIAQNFGRMDSDAETIIFRVVQQSLANVHRHSGSHVARIIIAASHEEVIAQVCDEGQGIPAEALDKINGGTYLVGVGMAGMRERVRDKGGKFTVRSSSAGTTVEVRLPLTASAAAPSS